MAIISARFSFKVLLYLFVHIREMIVEVVQLSSGLVLLWRIRLEPKGEREEYVVEYGPLGIIFDSVVFEVLNELPVLVCGNRHVLSIDHLQELC